MIFISSPVLLNNVQNSFIMFSFKGSKKIFIETQRICIIFVIVIITGKARFMLTMVKAYSNVTF